MSDGSVPTPAQSVAPVAEQQRRRVDRVAQGGLAFLIALAVGWLSQLV